MRGRTHHAHSQSETVNHRAQLAKAYQELGKELSSGKIKVVGNYTLGKVIGEGTYGKVRMGTHRLTSTRVAIKQIPKEFSAQLTREIHHHRRLHHPNVTQLYEVIATESSIWLVTELCSGGELFDYLVEKGRISETECRRLFGQLCLALHYIHTNNAVHRDLKLENVLLDDRCNVKIGDFGFTREYEQNRLLDTFCGTTGYAAPEMLLAQKYLGPEVDIWSLGIILYCLLTGTLPFDDDNEDVMKAKIILGEFEVPEWLSQNAQDLIRGILRKRPADRLAIPQILAHSWFSETQGDALPSPPPFELNFAVSTKTDDDTAALSGENSHVADETITVAPEPGTPASESSSTTSDAAYYSASSDVALSDLTTMTTPEAHPSPTLGAHSEERPLSLTDTIGVSRSWSQSTLGKSRITGDASSKHSDSVSFAAVPEERNPLPTSLSRASSMKSKTSAPPSSYPTRTPVRTKRRSVTSNISAPSSPTEPLNTQVSDAPAPIDYASLLEVTAPVMFTSPLERSLLNSLSVLGFDTGQIAHSVLTDACDASGAIWWLLKRKAERRELAEAKRIAEERRKTYEALGHSSKPVAPREVVDILADTSSDSLFAPPLVSDFSELPTREPSPAGPPVPPLKPLVYHAEESTLLSAPQISFVPPTPTAITYDQIQTPPRVPSPTSKPSFSLDVDGTVQSATASPSTPKDKGRHGKPRSGSVSMLQRAAGALVRKKSEEKVKDDNPESSKASSSRPSESTTTSLSSNSSPSLSHGVFASATKLTKSPSTSKGKERDVEETPKIASVLTPGSPWTVTSPLAVSPQLSTRPSFKFMTSPNFLSTHDEQHVTTSYNGDQSHEFEESGGSGASKGRTQRASLLTVVRTWFQEDKKKGKAKVKSKPTTIPLASGSPVYFQHGQNVSTPVSAGRSVAGSYRGLSGRKKNAARRHDKRPSVSSRRSSSVNSRRSSIASIQQKRPSEFIGPTYISADSMHSISRQRSDPSRRSFGSRTPTSEVGSRPSSIRSFSITPMARAHRARSPSQSSTGSGHARRTASPMLQYHRRVGSGSSARVIRQLHRRNNSATSSTRSHSRPGSFEAFSDTEFGGRGSPALRDRKSQPTTVFVAHKQGNVFGAPSSARPYGSVGRSSWKKSWGIEPPGWSSRTGYITYEIETLSDPGHGGTFRDVFTGRQSLDPNDDSDWVDEDDDVPAFAGGLGQLPASALTLSTSTSATTLSSGLPPSPSLVTKRELPSVPSNRSRTKRVRPLSAPPQSHSLASDNGRSTAHRASPTPPPNASLFDHAKTPSPEIPHSGQHNSGPRSRRQLPSGRNGPAFRTNAIQEEDEEEEEE